MPYDKTVLCLANSRKMSGRCVAGKEFVGGKAGTWIRPVSARPTEELSDPDRNYQNGEDPQLLDIIKIEMLRAAPKTYQRENHVINEKVYWTKMGRATWGQALTAVDKVRGPLWVNGPPSSYGINDRVPEPVANVQSGSLLLIRPDNLRVAVAPEWEGQRKVRVLFSLNGENYKLSLTDHLAEQAYMQGKNGIFPIQNALLCVSLGELYSGFAYKLAAGLITP